MRYYLRQMALALQQDESTPIIMIGINQLRSNNNNNNNNMNAQEKILQLNQFLSKLLDSLCFQLSVNIPDENSLSLLEIVAMRRKEEISHEEMKEIYVQWLASKNVFDIFTAKQIKTFPKTQLILAQGIQAHLSTTNITRSLELINLIYNEMYLNKKHSVSSVQESRVLQQIQQIFQYLDSEGVIHLRLGQLFFVTGAMLICENYTIPLNYQTFKVHFKQVIKEMCEIDGLVSLRWFKNWILSHNEKAVLCKNMLPVLKEVQKLVSLLSGSKHKQATDYLPNIIDEAFSRWKAYPRFNSSSEAKKRKIENYRRLFQENQYIFYFNGTEQQLLSQHFFIKKYGDEFVKCFEIDSLLLKQFGQIVREILNQYVGAFVKVGNYFHRSIKVTTSFNTSSLLQTHKKKQGSELPKLQSRTSMKERTPKKKPREDIDRKNVTPTHRNYQRTSPLTRQFGSTQKSIPRAGKPRDTTPTKSSNTGWPSSYPIMQQVYKGARKQGLQKDNFYQKLFFFRNKRVQSYDIVMKRLKGR